VRRGSGITSGRLSGVNAYDLGLARFYFRNFSASPPNLIVSQHQLSSTFSRATNLNALALSPFSLDFLKVSPYDGSDGPACIRPAIEYLGINDVDTRCCAFNMQHNLYLELLRSYRCWSRISTFFYEHPRTAKNMHLYRVGQPFHSYLTHSNAKHSTV
jgi:hypothetical protein